jgi:hypothetical protein
MKTRFVAVWLCVPQVLVAQTLAKVSFDQKRVAINQAVSVRVDFQNAEKPWCGLRINFGDGDTRDVRVEEVPLSLTKAYAAAGTYTLSLEGKTLIRGIKSAAPCGGELSSEQLVVFDPVAEEKKRAEEAALKHRADELARREEELKREQAKAAAAAAAAAEAQAKAAAEKKAAAASAPKAKPPPDKRPI